MPSSPSSSFAPNPSREWALLHASFVLIGVITTLLGPILPSFSHRWSLNDAQAGFFFTSQYFFSTLGVILTSVLFPRFGFSKVIGAGFVSFVIGFAFLGLGPWTISALMVGINGFGYGLANPAINLRSTELPSRNTAAAVTLLNFSWSVGSVLCPFLVGALLPLIHLRGFGLLLGFLSLVLVALHFLSSRETPQPVHALTATHSWADWLAHLRLPQAIPLLSLFFLYVGVEVALGGWVATVEKRLPGMSTITLVIAPSMFYGALLFGRGVAPIGLRYASQVAISVGGLLLAALGGSLIVISRAPHMLYVGAAIAGLGLAAQYPIFITWLTSIFRQDSNWIGALFFGAAGIGGGAIPWLVGIVSSTTHSLRAGLFLPLAITFLMIFLVFRARPSALTVGA
jgi:FHS family glucose/mannose:H+ symporter-like MFS transporter